VTRVSTSAGWPWPDDLDAMIAAPAFHTVRFEDNRVRVLAGRVSPGDTVPIHTHRWGGVLYIIGSSDFVRRDPDGNVLADTRASRSRPIAGSAVWCMPLSPHSFENVGSEEFRTLTVEMKDKGGNQAIRFTSPNA
jgi:quercetin dioxygenase-like cupin family protein